MALLSTQLPYEQMLTKWSSTLNPMLANPLNGVSILLNIKLVNGVNVVNHLLGKVQQGWFLVDIQGPATIYRSAAFNDKTLTLTSSAAVTVSIGVY